jgi:Fe-S-cluster-containing dehydrogenase component
MTLSRRTFLRAAASVCGANLVGLTASRAYGAYQTPRPARGKATGVLVDTTRCIGCRSCEAACNEANKLPKPEVSLYDQSVFTKPRRTSARAYTVVNAYPKPGVNFVPTEMGQRITAKSQCMHCQEPACASACFVRALEKTSQGPVIYHEDRCVGCRYCMVACPFSMPKFEWDKAIPAIRKCHFCYERQLQGKKPACVEACPAEALVLGTRDELLHEARSRIYQNPGRYARHIYGEHEVGGTSWLYLSEVPFDALGFRADLGLRPYPELTQSFLSAVPLVLILWPALLMGCYSFSRSKEEASKTGETALR